MVNYGSEKRQSKNDSEKFYSRKIKGGGKRLVFGKEFDFGEVKIRGEIFGSGKIEGNKESFNFFGKIEIRREEVDQETSVSGSGND